MKILFLADLHVIPYDKLQELLSIDKNLFYIVITLGDIDTLLYKIIVENFKDKRIIGVLGNHDYKGDLEYWGIENLHSRRITINDTSFVGIEGCVKYKEADMPLHTQNEIITICNSLNKADIVISHNSPRYIHDKDDLPHQGYIGLLNYIEKNEPNYVIHGHQHKTSFSEYKNTEIIGVYGGIILDIDNEAYLNVLEIY